ncbi:hypothetical protein LTR35_004241 [Friedmanniomyces endolithicus]|nr:hypothetical protein LTR35_004241 [Friedmanniomyces endolithicus]KAK0294477.1 hypothetical protein LTS00_007068 [Friedmanniomyces endolithicus]KAK1017622.1 hypothetical protein LTR54_002280 [Friedmanniomyces endolithicus]
MQFIYTILVLLSSLTVIRAAMSNTPGSSRSEYVNYAMDVTRVLNDKWFDIESGLWDGMWWQSANILTTMADLASINPDFNNTANFVFKNVFTAALATNGGTWLNGYYDDEGWWAMAFIKVYDVTGSTAYLSAAEEIFEDLRTGLNATVLPVAGNDPAHVNSINNELFIDVAASLGNRVQQKRDYYRRYAEHQANWFLNAGLLTKNNTFHDGLHLATYTAEGPIFSYNQGVILGALVELSKVTGNSTWLDHATETAQGTIRTLVDHNGIFTETGEFPTHGTTAGQFKGVFARNLAYLQSVRGDESYVALLTKSADSIWQHDRDEDGFLGPDWQGPVYGISAAAQGSALDCLVAAAAVSA